MGGCSRENSVDTVLGKASTSKFSTLREHWGRPSLGLQRDSRPVIDPQNAFGSVEERIR